MEKIELKTIDPIVLGEYIIKHYGPMSHLKLQKLLYYCDAYHLAYFQRELLTERFEAWVHGPVCPSLYHRLKDLSVLYDDLKYSYEPGETDVDTVFETLTGDQKQLIKDVLDTLSKWTGFELECATHRDLPWIEARKGYGEADVCTNEISKELTMNYYRKELFGDAKDK